MDTNRDRRAVALGAYGERIAARFLTEAGMRVIDRNWRCPQGEIDIVALDGDCLVVCEVKTRRTDAYGDAVEAVTPRKLARLRTLAGCWIEAHAPHGARGDVRIDVVGVLRPVAGPSRVTHLRGVTA